MNDHNSFNIWTHQKPQVNSDAIVDDQKGCEVEWEVTGLWGEDTQFTVQTAIKMLEKK